MTHSGPKCKFSWLYLLAIKKYRNLIISIVFYCFSHLWRYNPQNINIEVLIFCMEPHFAMIHHLWKFHLFSISRTYSKNRGKVPPPMYGVAQNRSCGVGLKFQFLFEGALIWGRMTWGVLSWRKSFGAKVYATGAKTISLLQRLKWIFCKCWHDVWQSALRDGHTQFVPV